MRSAVIPKTAPRESLGLLRKEPRAKRSRWVPWATGRCSRSLMFRRLLAAGWKAEVCAVMAGLTKRD